MSELELLKRMLEREKRARKEAEALMEQKSRELYGVNEGLRRTTQELTAARNIAFEASRAKSAFLANVSHELRTPLNAIIGYSEILAESAAEAGRVDELADLQKIQAAGKHLLNLIDDVLDVSKIEAGKMDLHLETFEVRSIVDEVISTVTPLIAKNDNVLKLRCPGSLGSMRADLTKLRQALLNLLSNASKFTKCGVISLTVARERSEDADWFKFEVQDSGIGMSEEQIRKLFQPFAQADSATSKNYGGTGLGLVLTRSFCRMMGGDLTVLSALGGGSTFTIRLPAEVSGTRRGAEEAALEH